MLTCVFYEEFEAVQVSDETVNLSSLGHYLLVSANQKENHDDEFEVKVEHVKEGHAD